jgi:hypothetical protein
VIVGGLPWVYVPPESLSVSWVNKPEREEAMTSRRFEVEEIMDSLATISEILFRRLKCMECNQCEPCGVAFMEALEVLRGAGEVKGLEAGRAES